MSNDRKKDKELLLDLETQIRDISQQFSEQLRSLDQRLEWQVGLLYELQEFHKRRSEIEMEFGKSLEKTAKQINQRYKDNKQKREHWSISTIHPVWMNLLNITKSDAQQHISYSDGLNTIIASKMTEIIDDIQRYYKKCREAVIACQQDITKGLLELINAMKTYQACLGERWQAEDKLQKAQSQRTRADQTNSLAKKFVNYEKKTGKKKEILDENKLKSVRARNDYLLAIENSNRSLCKYFEIDFPNLVQKLDLGFHATTKDLLNTHISMRMFMHNSEKDQLNMLTRSVADVKQLSDFDNFRTTFQKNFMKPNKFSYHPHRSDEIYQVLAQQRIQNEMNEQFLSAKKQISENDKTQEKLKQALSILEQSMTECTPSFQIHDIFTNDIKTASFHSPCEKTKEEKIKQEDEFINTYKQYLLNDNAGLRWQIRHDIYKNALGDINLENCSANWPPSTLPKPKGKGIMVKNGKAIKLFGHCIDEYVKTSGEVIPNLVRSCINYIHKYGMQALGIFRISASAKDISQYGDLFEKGVDPFQNMSDSEEVFAVACLLKLYFRQLKDPILSSNIFEQLIKISVMKNDQEPNWKECLKQVLITLPKPRLILLRYIFAFFNHITDYKNQNMMDAHNLSICIGPNLTWPSLDYEKSQLDDPIFVTQINCLIEKMIINHEEIFVNIASNDDEDYDFVDSNIIYNKYILDRDQDDSGDFVSDDDTLKISNFEDDEDKEISREGVSNFNYTAQSESEITVEKGDSLQLLKRISKDFWQVKFKGQIGILPDKIITYAPRKWIGQLVRNRPFNRSAECLLSSQLSDDSSNLDKASSQPDIPNIINLHNPTSIFNHSNNSLNITGSKDPQQRTKIQRTASDCKHSPNIIAKKGQLNYKPQVPLLKNNHTKSFSVSKLDSVESIVENDYNCKQEQQNSTNNISFQAPINKVDNSKNDANQFEIRIKDEVTSVRGISLVETNFNQILSEFRLNSSSLNETSTDDNPYNQEAQLKIHPPIQFTNQNNLQNTNSTLDTNVREIKLDIKNCPNSDVASNPKSLITINTGSQNFNFSSINLNNKLNNTNNSNLAIQGYSYNKISKDKSNEGLNEIASSNSAVKLQINDSTQEQSLFSGNTIGDKHNNSTLNIDNNVQESINISTFKMRSNILSASPQIKSDINQDMTSNVTTFMTGAQHKKNTLNNSSMEIENLSLFSETKTDFSGLKPIGNVKGNSITYTAKTLNTKSSNLNSNPYKSNMTNIKAASNLNISDMKNIASKPSPPPAKPKPVFPGGLKRIISTETEKPKSK